MSEEINEPTIGDLNAIHNALKSAIEQINFPETYSEDLINKLKNDFFHITVKISNHPKFSDVERYISVNNVEISFGLVPLDKRFIKLSYSVIHVKEGEDVSKEFTQYNPPIIGDMLKTMMPRMLDGTPVKHTNKYVVTKPATYDVTGNLISVGGEEIVESVLKFPMFEVMMPLFNAPISDREIVIAFIKENDIDGFFNR